MYTVNEDYVHTFAGNPLDRGQHLRRDEAALQALQDASSSRFLLFYQLKVATQATGQLAWIAHGELPFQPRQLVFLGLDNGVGRFAVSIEEASCVGCIDALSD